MPFGPIDMALYFASKGFSGRVTKYGREAAEAWLDDPESSFNRIHTGFLTDEERASVRSLVLSGATPPTLELVAKAMAC